MTHAELRACYVPLPGVSDCNCPGRIEIWGDLLHWRCTVCGHVIVIDPAADRIVSDGPDPRAMIASLAEAMRVKRS